MLIGRPLTLPRTQPTLTIKYMQSVREVDVASLRYVDPRIHSESTVRIALAQREGGEPALH